MADRYADDKAKLAGTLAALGDSQFNRGVAALASLVPEMAEQINERLQRSISAGRNQVAGLPSVAAEDMGFLGNGKGLDNALLEAIQKANSSDRSPADKKLLAGAVTAITGRTDAATLLNDIRVQEQERNGLQRLFGAGRSDKYEQLLPQINEQAGKAVTTAIANTAGDPFKPDLAKYKTAIKQEPLSAEMQDVLKAIGGNQSRLAQAIAGLASNVPDRSDDLLKAAREFAANGGDKEKAALTRTMLSVAETFSQRSGGADDGLASTLAELSGNKANAARISVLLHTAAAASKKIEEVGHNGGRQRDNDPMFNERESKHNELKRLQERSEAEITSLISGGVVRLRDRLVAEQAAAAVVAGGAAATPAAETPATAPAPSTPSTPSAGSSKGYVTEIKVEGGKTIAAEEVQKALRVLNANLGKYGPAGDGVDGKFGGTSLAALNANADKLGGIKKAGSPEQIVLTEEQAKKIMELAKSYKAPERSQGQGAGAPAPQPAPATRPAGGAAAGAGTDGNAGEREAAAAIAAAAAAAERARKQAEYDKAFPAMQDGKGHIYRIDAKLLKGHKQEVVQRLVQMTGGADGVVIDAKAFEERMAKLREEYAKQEIVPRVRPSTDDDLINYMSSRSQPGLGMSHKSGAAPASGDVSAVSATQNDYNKLAAVTLKPDALRGGAAAAAAISDYQTKHGLTPTGEFNAQTRAAISEEMSQKHGPSWLHNHDNTAAIVAANLKAQYNISEALQGASAAVRPQVALPGAAKDTQVARH